VCAAVHSVQPTGCLPSQSGENCCGERCFSCLWKLSLPLHLEDVHIHIESFVLHPIVISKLTSISDNIELRFFTFIPNGQTSYVNQRPREMESANLIEQKSSVH
jgi:hypothetical protein